MPDLATRLSALDAAMRAPFTPDREEGYWNALMDTRNALPALVDLVAAAERYLICTTTPPWPGTETVAEAEDTLRAALASLDATLGPRTVTSPRMTPSGDTAKEPTR